MDKWNDERDQYLRDNFEAMTHEEMAQHLGSTRPAVRNRCWRLGLRKKELKWTQQDVDKLKALCQVPDMTDIEIAKVMGRSKAGISLKISRYGFAGSRIKTPKPKKQPKYATKEERLKAQGLRVKKHFAEHGHPRGMLGKKHTQEVKDVIGQKARAWSKNLSEDRRHEMTFKAMRTRAANGTMQNMNRSNASWKAGWREIGGINKYYRSRWEANYARYLQWLKERGEIKDWLHEPVTFWFEGVKRGCVSYLPDFWVEENNGADAYHEVKGWMDDRSATKLKRMAKYHPTVKLVLIQDKQYKEIERKLSALIPGWES
jgi:hypothetical protein